MNWKKWNETTFYLWIELENKWKTYQLKKLHSHSIIGLVSSKGQWLNRNQKSSNSFFQPVKIILRRSKSNKNASQKQFISFKTIHPIDIAVLCQLSAMWTFKNICWTRWRLLWNCVQDFRWSQWRLLCWYSQKSSGRTRFFRLFTHFALPMSVLK